MMRLTIWDVQHGSAAYLKTPNGKHIVFDLGTGDHSANKSGFSPLQYLKTKCGVSQLDEVVITHPHTDHIDDIENFDLMSPKVLLRPKHLSRNDVLNANPSKDNSKVEKYLKISESYNIPVNSTNDPFIAENNGGVDIEYFIPKECGTSNINNHSIVTIIKYYGVKILLPGDNEGASWKELLENPEFKNAIKNVNVFVASHHGRESGYYADLFKSFTPNIVIISDGPAGETSVTEKYSVQAKGWVVRKRGQYGDQGKERKCLTTRNDGTIEIKVWRENETTYMDVTVE